MSAEMKEGLDVATEIPWHIQHGDASRSLTSPDLALRAAKLYEEKTQELNQGNIYNKFFTFNNPDFAISLSLTEENFHLVRGGLVCVGGWVCGWVCVRRTFTW